jgi:hypothetical protein
MCQVTNTQRLGQARSLLLGWIPPKGHKTLLTASLSMTMRRVKGAFVLKNLLSYGEIIQGTVRWSEGHEELFILKII